MHCYGKGGGTMSGDRTPILHRCCICGGPASYGYGVFPREDKPGRWYCREHRPAENSVVRPERRPIGRPLGGKQGELL